MALSNDQRELFLSATRFIDKDHPEVQDLAANLRCKDTVATAVAAFDWVRDEVRYEPRHALDAEELYVASTILARRSGYCVQKAVLLAALARCAGIPARLGFADVRNQKTPPWMYKLMGTNLFVFHGYVELHLNGNWLKATPAFDRGAATRAGLLLVELDGTGDAMLHPVDPEGHPSIEYVRHRGSYADVPVAEIRATFREVYGR
jgi:transglutaminase-like putative cysteine protease